MGNLNRITAVVVLYHPQADFINNIISYADFTHSIIVVDNSEISSPDLSSLINKYGEKFHLLKPGKNMGVAWALNEGTKRAIETGADWILSMDQDSYFDKTEIKNYIEKIPEFEIGNIGIAGPNHEGILVAGPDQMPEKDSVITSGCLFNKKVFELTSGFDEKLFIDEVDHEFCFHAKSLGVKIVQCMDIQLSHQLGEMKWVKIPYKAKSHRTFHSPKRLYFMVRNVIYLSKKYKFQFPDAIRIQRKDLLIRIKNHLLFGNKRLQFLQMVIKGIIDGYTRRMGNPF